MQIKPLWVVLGLVIVMVMGMGGCYNSLVSKQETVKKQWAQVENVLQRRMDLIPNLVSTVKGYAKHEKELLENITAARSQWGASKTPVDKLAASQKMDGLLSRLLVVAENYPNLKANENFLSLQNELSGTENRIAVERMRYNETVRDFDVAVKQFPSNLIARWFGFKPDNAYFAAQPQAGQVPKVEF